MKGIKRVFLFGMAVMLLFTFYIPTSAYNVGDKVSTYAYTDIVTYINNTPIESFNINWETAVIVEDLADYGFDVDWDPTSGARSLKVTRNYSKPFSATYKPAAVTHKNGDYAGDVLFTDIETYFDGTKVESFNINGRTIVYVNDLAKFYAQPGTYKYVDSTRTLSLKLKRGAKTTVEPTPTATPPITFTTQPVNVTAAVNESVSFKVAVNGGKSPYTYKWEIKKVSDTAWSDAVGASAEIYSFIASQSLLEGNYMFRCTVTDAEGSSISSDTALLLPRMTAVYDAPLPMIPIIITPGTYLDWSGHNTPSNKQYSVSVIFTAASAEKIYDGTALTASDVTAEGLPEGFTYAAKASGSQTNAGSSNNDVSSYCIYDADGMDVTANFSNISTEQGTLTVTTAPLTITTGSANKKYDGTSLTCNELDIIGLISGDEVTVTATGTITDVGATENTYTIDWGEVNPDNYSVTEAIGTLEVTVNDASITFTAASAEKIYDGTALTASDVTAEGLPEGFTYAAKASGSQTNAGSSNNDISSYCIYDADGIDVTANFSNISTEQGTLTVTPAPLTISTGSANKEYDGKPLTSSEASITGLAGVDVGKVTVTATGTITNVGSTDNTYIIDWGKVNPDNYTVLEDIGTLEVISATE